MAQQQQSPSANRFAVAVLMGVFEDEASFLDPFGLKTIYTVRREGSNVLQALQRARGKKNPLTAAIAQSLLSGGGGEVRAEMIERSGIDSVDALAQLGEVKLEDALAKLVKWEQEPNGVPYNAGHAREFLSQDGWIDRSKVPDEAWEILQSETRKEYESITIEGRKPFPGLTEIQVGNAYVVFIRYWSQQKEAFRAKTLEEAGKNSNPLSGGSD